MIGIGVVILIILSSVLFMQENAKYGAAKDFEVGIYQDVNSRAQGFSVLLE